jgi:hypothetical protein
LLCAAAKGTHPGTRTRQLPVLPHATPERAAHSAQHADTTACQADAPPCTRTCVRPSPGPSRVAWISRICSRPAPSRSLHMQRPCACLDIARPHQPIVTTTLDWSLARAGAKGARSPVQLRHPSLAAGTCCSPALQHMYTYACMHACIQTPLLRIKREGACPITAVLRPLCVCTPLPAKLAQEVMEHSPTPSLLRSSGCEGPHPNAACVWGRVCRLRAPCVQSLIQVQPHTPHVTCLTPEAQHHMSHVCPRTPTCSQRPRQAPHPQTSCHPYNPYGTRRPGAPRPVQPSQATLHTAQQGSAALAGGFQNPGLGLDSSASCRSKTLAPSARGSASPTK